MSRNPDSIDTSGRRLPRGVARDVERLAAHTHATWMQARQDAGWTSGPRNDVHKTTPWLVPYRRLPESEKEYDRVVVTEILKALLAMGYQISKPTRPRRKAKR